MQFDKDIGFEASLRILNSTVQALELASQDIEDHGEAVKFLDRALLAIDIEPDCSIEWQRRSQLKDGTWHPDGEARWKEYWAKFEESL